KHTLAHWQATELTSVENGPWEFGNYRYLGTSSELKKSDDTLNEKRLKDIERINHIIENDLTIDDILKNKKKLLPWSWLRSLKDLEYLIKKEKEIREANIKRFWRPCCIYLFGPGGSGKSGLVQKLFREELYSKPQKQKSGSNWWNGYSGQDIVFLMNDIVKLLNDTDEHVEIKNKGFIPFLAKYVFMTSRKASQEAFNFGNGQFERRLDFIIQFTGNWKNKTTQIHFLKGSEEDFRNMNWKIEFDRSEFSNDQIVEKIKTSGFKDGEIIFDNEKVLWKQNFPEFKKKYLRDYPHSKSLYEYKLELENPESVYNSEMSEYNSDDSQYTKEK
ncbi:18258_t:CDS:2, partial [Racocetra fulgida]